MPRTVEQQQAVYNHIYELFFDKLTRDEQNALNEIYTNEIKRLRRDDPSVHFDSAATTEVHKTLFTWIESGIVPLKIVVISANPNIDISKLDTLLQTTTWYKNVGHVITSDYVGPFTAGHKLSLEKGFDTITIPANYNFWNQVLNTVHAVIVIDDPQNSSRVKTQLASAQRAGLLTAIVNLNTNIITEIPNNFYISPNIDSEETIQ